MPDVQPLSEDLAVLLALRLHRLGLEVAQLLKQFLATGILLLVGTLAMGVLRKEARHVLVPTDFRQLPAGAAVRVPRARVAARLHEELDRVHAATLAGEHICRISAHVQHGLETVRTDECVVRWALTRTAS